MPSGGPNAGQTHRGIYKVEGKDLTVCHAPPGGERPTEFVSGEGSEDTLFLLERADEAATNERLERVRDDQVRPAPA